MSAFPVLVDSSGSFLCACHILEDVMMCWMRLLITMTSIGGNSFKHGSPFWLIVSEVLGVDNWHGRGDHVVLGSEE